MAMDLATLAHQTLDAAKRAGAEAADALVTEGDAIAMEIRAGKLETAERSEGVEIGLRVLIGRRQATVAISDSRAPAIDAMAERAVAMAKAAPEDPDQGLADPELLATTRNADGLNLLDTAPPPSPEALADAARAAEAAALGIEGISQVSEVGAQTSLSHFHLAASNGFDGAYARSAHQLYCVAITGEGTSMERDYAAEGRTHYADLPAAEEIGRLAAERALARRGAIQPKTGAFPVLFDERVASGLIGHLLSAINGVSVARGTSWLKDAMGEMVLPAELSIETDPLTPGLSGTRPFDAEGLPAGKRALVEDGKLVSWVLDLASARKLGVRPTGDATRGPGSAPRPSLGNIVMTEGPQDRATLASEMGEGLLVTSLMGASINPNTGDYSRGASGFWVRNGEIAEAVNECTIAGNLRGMLASITPANDARHHLSRRIPSLRVEGLTVAGQ
ncbi:MAG: TldD/PmbA family protein [Pseudomonadota bacterium]